MGNKLKAISEVSVALALLGAAVPAVEAAPTAMAAKKTSKKAKKSTKKAAKKSTKKAKKAKKTTKKKATKKVAKKTAAKKPAKKSVKKTTKKSVKKAVKKPVAKKPAKKSVKKTTKKSVKKAVKKPVAKNPAEDAYNNYKKQAAELGSLANAQNDLSQKQAALNSAKQAYTGAVAAYNDKVAAAKASYDEASRAYEAAGYDFIMSKATPNYYQDSKNSMSKESVLAGYVSGLDDSIKSVLSTTNLKEDITLVKELNNYRSTDNNFPNHNALGIDYDLMIFASIANVVGTNTYGHTYFAYSLDNEIISRSENLAWGYSDPLDGWYTEEKAIYDAHGSGVTGHYRNCMGDYDYVGLVLDQNTGTSAADFNSSRESSAQVSVEEFESALNSYVALYETALNAAKTTYEQTKADKSQVNNAQENVNNSKKVYDAADAKVKKVKTVNQQLAKAYTAYQKSLKAAHKKK